MHCVLSMVALAGVGGNRNSRMILPEGMDTTVSVSTVALVLIQLPTRHAHRPDGIGDTLDTYPLGYV